MNGVLHTYWMGYCIFVKYFLDSAVLMMSPVFSIVPLWTTGGCVAESEQKFYFSFKYSVPFQSSARRGAHRRAIMWFQCLGPCGIVPSGGKPLRLCWHITAPIISSRSALSFLLHLSSFSFFSVPFFCFACALISAPGSFSSTHPQHFSSNLLSQQSYLFFSHSRLRCTALNDCHSHKRITYFTQAQPGFGQEKK